MSKLRNQRHSLSLQTTPYVLKTFEARQACVAFPQHHEIRNCSSIDRQEHTYVPERFHGSGLENLVHMCIEFLAGSIGPWEFLIWNFLIEKLYVAF